MTDSEREPFYDDIAHVIQNTKKLYRLHVGFEPEAVKHLAALLYTTTVLRIKSVRIRIL